MSKLGLIIKREYIAKVRNKSFVIMTFLSPFLIVGMITFIVYLAQVNESDTPVIGVLNESEFFNDDFISNGNTSYLKYNGISLEAAKDSVKNSGFSGLLYVPNAADMESAASNAFFYSEESPSDDLLDNVENLIQNRLRQKRLENIGVSEDSYQAIDKRFNITTATFSGAKNLKGLKEMNAIIGGGFGYLIMMFIIIYGGFVMRSVIEEKTSRIIEVIISSVKPFQLMIGKIIGTSLAGITQFIIWIVSAALLMLIVFMVFDLDLSALQGSNLPQAQAMEMANGAMADASELQLYANEFLNIPWGIMIGFFIIYFVLGYLIYSSIYAAIGAAVDNETDTQQFMLPVIMPLMLAVYVGFISVFGNPHGPVAVGFSLFPLTSPIVMLMRLPGGIGEGGVPIWQLLTSISLLIVSFFGIVWLAAKIYRIGILSYGKKPSYKDLYKWLKY